MQSGTTVSPLHVTLPSQEEIHNACISGEAAVVQLVPGLVETIQELLHQMETQTLMTQELQAQQAKNSRTSSKPPSSDGLAKKPRPTSLRDQSSRPNGGQPGHEGHCLEMVTHPDQTVAHTVKTCRNCQASLEHGLVVGYDRRQVFDLPPVRMAVTEHQVEICECPHCGHRNQADVPANVTQPTQYGPNVKAHVVYFNHDHHIPLERTTEILADVVGPRLSEAVVIEANQECAAAVESATTCIKEHVKTASVVNFDETGIRVQDKLEWLQVACTPFLTYYQIHPKRGQEGLNATGILPEFQGVAVHDHGDAYFTDETCLHALCNAHHLRALKFVQEQYSQPWAGELSDLLVEIHEEIKRMNPLEAPLPLAQRQEFERRYDQIVEQGFASNPPPEKPAGQRGKVKQSAPKNLLDRLKADKSAVLRFMHDQRVPFDHNQAERDLRMIKVKQKISGVFRTKEGAHVFGHIRGYLSTAKKNACNIIHAIQRAFEGNPFVPLPT